MTLTIQDEDGQPISGIRFLSTSSADGVTYEDFFTTNSAGVGSFDAIPNSTAQVELRADGGYSSSVDGSQLRVVAGELVDATTPPAQPGSPHEYVISIPVGSEGAATSLTFPRLHTRRFHVVTEAGQPVYGAQVSALANVSVPQGDGQGGAYRIVNRNQPGANTNTAGWIDLTMYENEPDPTVVSQYSEFGNDRTGDGQVDGAIVYFNPKPTAQLSKWLTYTDWATSDNVTVVLPYVAEFVNTASVPGSSDGVAIVTTKLLQPTASGTVSPIVNKKVQLFRQAHTTGKSVLIGTTSTDSRGKARFKIKLADKKRVVVHVTGSHVAGIAMARPR